MADDQQNNYGWHMFLSKYCLKCIVRNLCCQWKLIVGNSEEIFKYLQSNYKIDSKWAFDSAKEFGSHPEYEKDHKVCLACSNILTTTFVNETVAAIQHKIRSENHEFTNFQLMIAMPHSFTVQEHAMKSVFTKYFGLDKVEKKPFTVKEIFKALLEPIIVKNFNAERKIEAEFEILLQIQSPEIDKVILPQLREFHPNSFKNPKKKNWQKPDEIKIATTQVVNALHHIQEAEIQRLQLSLDSISGTHSKPLLEVKLNHQPIYLAGRYNKYSRTLPQTPWIIDGVRKIENSVEEFIGVPMQAAFEASGYNFSSSGREDVDVRMLGNGRPFMIELINPKTCHKSQSFLQDLESKINCQTPDVTVSKLQIVEKSDSKLLKEGEAEKTKSYSAICCFIQPPTINQLEKLENLHQNKDVEIQQKTPIRVLHRRTVATRSRKIISMKAEQLNSNSQKFKLHLVTQAGTYVKEFVHSDFGRTVPSLQSFLDAEVDIIDLDVVCVNFDWPPS